MKEEMAFLKYRREVVSAWPDSPRKTAFLAAIESRILMLEQQFQTEQRVSESVHAVG